MLDAVVGDSIVFQFLPIEKWWDDCSTCPNGSYATECGNKNTHMQDKHKQQVS